ncbi:hypothetical protein BDD14_2008 [Edaphobacter modestus]|uniref:Uncharacterized protein n=1 Tax=Edaphobacter modestus TaxID=388466 RepID=A0A4Q7YU88_9BACT|nr:hypothetical protein BDD14_2008 [Edaphobacter modestus]
MATTAPMKIAGQCADLTLDAGPAFIRLAFALEDSSLL